MTGLDRDTSRSPDRTGVCCTGRCAPSQCETITGPSFSSLNKPDQERTPAYRDSSGSESPSGCLLCYFFRRLGGAIWGIPARISQIRSRLLRHCPPEASGRIRKARTTALRWTSTPPPTARAWQACPRESASPRKRFTRAIRASARGIAVVNDERTAGRPGQPR